jgi:hypothetical protein
MRQLKIATSAILVVSAGLLSGAAACGSTAATKHGAAATVTHTATPAKKKSAAPKPAVTSVPARAPAPAQLPVLAAGTYRGVEPGTIYFSGDAGNVVQVITWTSWNANGATGTGMSDIQGCVPDCATGSETPVPATITLSDPVNGAFRSITEVRDGNTYTGWPEGAATDPGQTPVAVPAPSRNLTMEPSQAPATPLVVSSYYADVNASSASCLGADEPGMAGS